MKDKDRKKQLDFENLPTHLRQRLYLSKINRVVFVENTNETTIYFLNKEKKMQEDFFSVKGKLNFPLTTHNLLVFLFKNKVLNPDKYWNVIN